MSRVFDTQDRLVMVAANLHLEEAADSAIRKATNLFASTSKEKIAA